MNRAVFALSLAALLVIPAYTQTLPGKFQAGRWEGALQLPGGKLDLLVDFSSEEGGWKGAITIPAQGAKGLALASISVVGGRLRFTLPGIPGDPHFEGTIGVDGTVANGMFIQGSAQLPLTLRRTGGTTTVAMKTEEAGGPQALRAGERVIHFPGFNAFPLNASVLAGDAHPFFAVMVAGSGPTDRDWSNPLIPMPSHGGRDIALWLQAQGIGSLRFDKRTIGAKDPKLDVSLDAVVGDIKAAMQAARSLPEARGKKLLLIGHSEGALLSLLAAGEADAALLLAMPGLSMGKLILAQVKAQLDGAQAPEGVSRENMTFLTAALDAVRQDKPLPQPSGGVAPGVARLVTMLTAPLTRGYIRDTLDLDPWGAAKRLSMPCAVVWGDRDVQTWKPEAISPDFKGTVLQIPEANHLFKHETRDKATLTGATAMTAYGDNTPLADLSPVAAWLKALK
jgi:pimeloyl-ACP methyl ester carboxylesterase